ncbi:MAG TPA: phage baseplate assembly protein V [Allocoleopsis sp.]
MSSLPMPNAFTTALAELVRLLPQIRELCQRQPTLQEAIVTRNDDPTGFRRIKATRAAQGGQAETDWFPAGRSSSTSDEPIPSVGTHILIGLVNGDPHQPFFLRTLSNQTNPPDSNQLNPTNDNTEEIPGDERRAIAGDRTTTVGGERSETIEGDCYLLVKGEKYAIDAEFGEILITALAGGVGAVRVEAADTIRFQQGGAYAQMQNGAWTFGNADGMKWTFGGSSWQWDANGAAIRIVNASDVSINGKSIAVVGAEDDRGDNLIDRGY